MSTIQRTLPISIEGRLMALSAAVDKEASLPPGTIIISAATKIRLLAINGLYAPAVLAVGAATSTSTNATRVKTIAQGLARMWSSHYYQALNNAVERAVYTPDVRSFFSLPVSSAAVPDMDSEEKLKLWGGRVSTGETAMVAAGNVPIAFPTEAQVKAKVTDYVTRLTAQSSAMTATDSAEETLNGLNDETDKVIKKVWDEVETFYNEETPESMRANAREWGVKYITLGDPTQIIFKAEDSVSHAGIEAAVFKFKSTGVKHTAGPEGSIEIETRLIGDEEVTATHPDYTTVQQTIHIVEGVPMTVVFSLVHLP